LRALAGNLRVLAARADGQAGSETAAITHGDLPIELLPQEASVTEQPFDTFTRSIAGMVSRRASLLTLGTAGLASLAAPVTTDTKANKKRNKKCKKDKKACRNDLSACNEEAAQCAAQGEQCTIFLTAFCFGEPNCLDSVPCCSILESCDFSGFFACLVDTSDG
jgi:hypothetical protein